MATKKTLSLLGIACILTAISWHFISPQEDIELNKNSNISATTPKEIAPPKTDDKSTGSQIALVPKSNLIAPIVTYDTYTSIHGPLPKSLRGTTIPASFSLDSNGHLIITKSIKSIIEYFLSVNGEEPLETIISRIEEFLTQQLEEPAITEALSVLTEYIDYKKSLVDMEKMLAENTEASGQASDYQTMFQYRREARMNALSPEIYDAFFANEDKADSYTAGILDTQRDASLTDQEKADQIIALEQLLPPEEQAIKQAERTRETLQQDIIIARTSGATDEQVFQMRAEAYDYETAERFAAADKKKFEWNTRFQQYREDRAKILLNDGLSEADKLNEIYTVQTDLFSKNEQRRLPTLDRIADSKVQL